MYWTRGILTKSFACGELSHSKHFYIGNLSAIRAAFGENLNQRFAGLMIDDQWPSLLWGIYGEWIEGANHDISKLGSKTAQSNS